jgi:alpha-tubulin suppressor-like RCC1 family protein
MMTGRAGNGYVMISIPPSTVGVMLDQNGTPAVCDVTSWTDTEIHCTTSAHSDGPVNVSVTINGETGTLNGGFSYLSLMPPTITNINPNHGPVTGNTAVEITGTDFMADAQFKQISSGFDHTCAIVSNDQVYCWGSNSAGRLGNNGSFAYNSFVPVAVDTTGVLNGKTILSMSAGWAHTCAIASDNQAYCWGYNGMDQLGDNSITDRYIPTAVDTSGVLAGKTILSISAGYYHTCAIASDNQAYCWGANWSGQLGNNSTTRFFLVPVPVDTTGALNGKTILSIATGESHTCAIASDNQVYCWGINGSAGQLGNNSTTNSLVPVPVDTSGVLNGKTILSIATGASHTCAIASDNQVYCWGWNGDGQLGDNSITNSPVPVAVDTTGALNGKTILSLSAGYSHTCALDVGGAVYCWGYNHYGQLGDNSTTDRHIPTPVDTTGALNGKTILSLSTSESHTCAIASDNQAYCWGRNDEGQLGDNTTTNRFVPVAISNPLIPIVTSVTFDASGTPAGCIDMIVVSDTKLTCTTTAHAPGLVSITINHGSNSSVTMPAKWLDTGANTSTDQSVSNIQSGFLYESLYVSLAVSTSTVNLGSLSPTLSGAFTSNSSVVTARTNYPDGYNLSISTDEQSTNPNASHMKHDTLSAYINGASHTCSWNNTSKTFTDATVSLSNNTWGFTLNSANLASQQFCQVPNADSPLTIKSTTTANETGDTTTFYYGARVDMTKPAGQYKATVVYTAVGNI